MKKRTMLSAIMLTVCVILVTSCGSSKSSSKPYTREKEINEKMAELAKGGWQIHGTTRTLQGKLTEHYSRMDATPDLYEVIGTSTGCRSITVCRAAALNSASVEVATKMAQDLKGKTMRDMGFDEAAEVSTEYNKFQNACIGKFQAAIQGDLQESMALIQKRDGTNNYEIYYLVDKESARKKRTQAIKDALEESKLRQEYARSIEKFINDDFNID